MRAVVQRVTNASVFVDNKLVNEINDGLLVYLGINHTDDIKTANKIINKIVNLRIFSDHEDKLNLNIDYVKGEILLISQFTLYGDVRKSNRPSFTEASNGEDAIKLYNYIIDELNKKVKTKGGIFGHNMDVRSTNSGPVTILIEY